MSSSDKHFELGIGIAKDGLKYLFIFNAGAATSLIALTDKLPNGRDYTYAVLLFGLGALGVTLAYTFGYFSQLFYANHVLETEKRQTEIAARQHCFHNAFQVIAAFFVTISLVSGTMGLWTAFLEAQSK
ncbi:MAG TPA: hypothetical protein VFQ69_02030 [Rhizomicrobium sp.]|nr:hypothetical protein [Rhizomicrobium sp.]